MGLRAAYFENNILDPYLKDKAINSLCNAQNDQQYLYDFSFSRFNMERRGPKENDLGIIVLLSPEEKEMKNKNSMFNKFMQFFFENKAKIYVVLIAREKKSVDCLKENKKLSKDSFVAIYIDEKNDPFGINQQVALKMLLNAHSTAIMTKLGKVVGNTMTNVSPSNLKLIGRATYLIQSHVNEVLTKQNWIKNYGLHKKISYAEANEVLFDSIEFLKNNKNAKQIGEVAFSIIRVLESLRAQKEIDHEKVLEILRNMNLNQYLSCIKGY